MFFLLFLLDDLRIRIRIQEAQTYGSGAGAGSATLDRALNVVVAENGGSRGWRVLAIRGRGSGSATLDRALNVVVEENGGSRGWRVLAVRGRGFGAGAGSATLDRALNVVVAVRMAGAGDDESWLYGDDSKGEDATEQTGHLTFSPFLKGTWQRGGFSGVLHKSVRHWSLTLHFKLIRFWLRIRGDIRNRKTTPRLTESGSRQDSLLCC